MRTTTLFLIVFGIFLIALIFIDIMMIVSLLNTGDKRRKLMVWKASFFTLLVTVLGLISDVITAVLRAEAMRNNPFIELSVIAMTYFLTLLYYKKRYGRNMKNIIRNRRKELGFSQDELAKKCDVSGKTINAIENNKYDPTLSLAFKLSKELHITVDELFDLKIYKNVKRDAVK